MAFGSHAYTQCVSWGRYVDFLCGVTRVFRVDRESRLKFNYNIILEQRDGIMRMCNSCFNPFMRRDFSFSISRKFVNGICLRGG